MADTIESKTRIGETVEFGSTVEVSSTTKIFSDINAETTPTSIILDKIMSSTTSGNQTTTTTTELSDREKKEISPVEETGELNMTLETGNTRIEIKEAEKLSLEEAAEENIVSGTITTTEFPFSSEASLSFLQTEPSNSSADSNIFAPDFFYNDNDTNIAATTEFLDITTTNYTNGGNGSDYNYYYYDYYNDNDTRSNPLLGGAANDDYYNWYDHNDNDTEPYDYNQGVASGSKRNETKSFEEIWKNINIPPRILPLTYLPKDLNKYFLTLPPLLCLSFLVLVFMPCILLKWRDDCREAMGLQRKYGSNRQFKVRKEKEARERGDEEERRMRRERRLAARQNNEVEYVTYSQAGQSSSGENSTVSPKPIEENRSRLIKENRNNNLGMTTSNDVDGPIVYTGEEISCIVVDKRDTVDDRALSTYSTSNEDNSRMSESASSSSKQQRNSEVGDTNFSTSAKGSQAKFTGWNKDLYSNAGGFGPPAARGSSSPKRKVPGNADDPEWGMY